MTADEWGRCEDPALMLENAAALISARKVDLWIYACRAKANPDLSPQDSVLWGDLSSPTDRRNATGFWLGKNGNASFWLGKNEQEFLNNTCPLAYRCHLLREIMGNPFRNRESWVCEACGGSGECSVEDLDGRTIHSGTCNRCQGSERLLPAWFTPQAIRLVRAAAESRGEQPNSLNPDALAVLADALEEAGCQEQELLGHLRGFERCDVMRHYVTAEEAKRNCEGTTCVHCRDHNGWRPLPCPHQVGCWAVELLLGKE